MNKHCSNIPIDQEALYQALVNKDSSYDGHVFVGVTSTGIFCRFVCPARRPKAENCTFYVSAADAMAAGFRPCKRCRPLEANGSLHPTIARLVQAVENDPEKIWSEWDLADLHLDPSTVRRLFREHFGQTFLQYARARQLGFAASRLRSGGSVLNAQLDAGYESGSGFRDAFNRTFGKVPTAAKFSEFLFAKWIETPIGAMLAVANAKRLHLLEFHDRTALPRELHKLQQAAGKSIGMGSTPPLRQITGELQTYFAGDSAQFETPVVEHGSAFTRHVWNALRAIPLGETRSYADVARTVGKPTGYRAVARANGANQIALVIPCHRVIGADGRLTGYGGKLWRKDWLLRHEQKMLQKTESPRI